MSKDEMLGLGVDNSEFVWRQIMIPNRIVEFMLNHNFKKIVVAAASNVDHDDFRMKATEGEQ